MSKWTNEEISFIRNNRKLSRKDLAKRFKTSTEAIRKIEKRYNIPPRNNSDSISKFVVKQHKAKILFLDIENSPNISYTWGKYEQDVIAFKQEWHMLSFAYKWLDDKNVKAFSLPDFKTYKKDKTNDAELLKELWKLFNETDIMVGHNLDRFDVRKTNARFLANGLPPPAPFKTIDTLKIAKRVFFLNSNKLGDISKLLKIGKKEETGGFNLWLDCMAGNPKAWKKMVKYNKQDIVLLEKVYLKLLSWAENTPNINVYQGTTNSCPKCGHNELQKRGYGYTKTQKYQKYQCNGCHGWSSGEKIQINKVLLK